VRYSEHSKDECKTRINKKDERTNEGKGRSDKNHRKGVKMSKGHLNVSQVV
jgi:hypothetical protein